MKHVLSLRLFGAVCALALFAGCPAEQAPINRVQPNYFAKSFFIGEKYLDVADDPEFYSQGTLVDVGYGAGQDGLFTSTYAQPLTRVKWSVTEDLLIARLAYERVTNSDGKGVGKETNSGIVVAAFRIASHFDVKRDYNPSTGEQSNVISENTFDRPWYEREFIRVDWSKNLSTDNYDYDTLAQLGIYGGISYEPLAYYVNDPDATDAPHYDQATGYLDVTNKAWAKPQMIDLSMWGMGQAPACWVDPDVSGGTAPTTGCAPVELTIRQTFMKVPKTDYEPADWDGFRFQAFGAFTTDRNGYARNYGMTDSNWHRFINRYNIWERSHAYADPTNMLGETKCFTPETTPAGLDPHRDVNSDGTEDECAAVGRGSRCDSFSQRCTLPFRDRTVKPIAWFYADGSNPEFFEATRLATIEWDVAMRTAVQTARYVECRRVGDSNCEATYPMYNGQADDNQDLIDLAREVELCRMGRAYQGTDCNVLADNIAADRGYSPGVLFIAKQSPVVVLCHSPVESNDPVACGTPRLPDTLSARACFDAHANNDKAVIAECNKALNVRKGDLRHHQVNSITTPQTPSPWGIMVDSNDPLTGEVVAASINVWTHVNDLWSQGIVDTARYIKGELETPDVTEGTYVREWSEAAAAATKGGSLPKFHDADSHEAFLEEMVGVQDHESFKKLKKAMEGSQLKKQIKSLKKDLRQVRADLLAPSSTQATYEARRKHALNTPTEAALTTKMMQSLVSKPGAFDNTALAEISSPLRGANPSVQRNFRNMRELALADRGACIMNEAPAPLAIADMANVLQQKFGNFDKTQPKADQLARAERMRKYLASRAHYAVITHEMGHSIGLRHNFVSSSDAYNYRPQYWQLRTNNGANTTACAGSNTNPVPGQVDCVGPRYLDPVNDNERANMISMFMQSTTMDYAGEAAQDMLGLGTYDFAAARMFYGDVVSVYTDPDVSLGQPKASFPINKMDTFGGLLGFQYTDAQDNTIHYSQLQKDFGLIQNCANIDVNRFKPGSWDTATQGEWSPLLDGLIVTVDGQASRCHQRPVDYESWNRLSTAGGASSPAVDPYQRIRVPYGFATDRWADLGNLAVYRHDNGADPYELFDFLITQQEVNHIFDNYRRGRQTFSVRNAASRTLSRYNEKLRDAAKGLGLMANVYRDFAASVGYEFESLWPYIAVEFFGENYFASGLGFDHFARQLSRPQAGPHSPSTSIAGETILASNLDAAGNPPAATLNIPNGATGLFGNVTFGGRPVENNLAENRGEYDSEYTVNAGSYYDKAYTSMLMTESVDNFISASRRDFVDARYRAVSLADVFPDGYRRWLANNLTGDTAIKGARVLANGTRPAVDADLYPTTGMGFPSWWRAVPQVCFQQANNLACDTQPANMLVVDPEVGWEQQKFLIAWTMMYLPENAKQTWLNQLGIWEIGADNDPGFPNRIELHLPDGKVYVAKTFGTETLFGKTVQKGIGARMLEWANLLLQKAYDTDAGPDLDGNGTPDWYLPKLKNGQPLVRYDPSIDFINANTGGVAQIRTGCSPSDNSQCVCSSNKACIELTGYQELPFFLRQAMRDFGVADPSMKGIY